MTNAERINQLEAIKDTWVWAYLNARSKIVAISEEIEALKKEKPLGCNGSPSGLPNSSADYQHRLTDKSGDA